MQAAASTMTDDDHLLLIAAVEAMERFAYACGFDPYPQMLSTISEFTLAFALNPIDARQGLAEIIADYEASMPAEVARHD
ncbi:MAG: hypothetical protein ABL904_21225 [Hyphomicrobiaceae bacterium]